MPTTPEVQASKTVNSLDWMSPRKFLQYQSNKAMAEEQFLRREGEHIDYTTLLLPVL